MLLIRKHISLQKHWCFVYWLQYVHSDNLKGVLTENYSDKQKIISHHDQLYDEKDIQPLPIVHYKHNKLDKIPFLYGNTLAERRQLYYS